jgi:hypothetical protein
MSARLRPAPGMNGGVNRLGASPTRQENEDKTGIPTEQVRFITYARPHAWVLWNARVLNPLRPYNHPPEPLRASNIAANECCQCSQE